MADNEEKKKKEGKRVPESERLADPVTMPAGDPPPLVRTDTAITSWPSDGSSFNVALQGTPIDLTNVHGFWEYLRQRTDAVRFSEYSDFIERVLCEGNVAEVADTSLGKRITRFQDAKRIAGVDTYQLLRAATEAFLLVRCGSLGIPG